ncbi:MAG: Crp/Fnr family transcriptional regulator [Rhizobacter sp.]
MNSVSSLQQPSLSVSPGGLVVHLTRTGLGADRDSLSHLLALIGVDAGGMKAAADTPVLVKRVPAGEALFHEGVSADSIYFVRSGTFKTFRTAEDGYEQVLGFVGRSEVLGFDALNSGGHPTGAVALEDSSVYAILITDLFSLTERSPALGRGVHRAVSNALARHGQIADVMAAVAAEVRLARFLCHLSQQMAEQGQSPRRFHLRMSRRDIASYLGVAHETISRSFTELSNWGLLRVNNREVEIVDVEGLKVLSRSTRRQIDDMGRALERPAQAQRAEPRRASVLTA